MLFVMFAFYDLETTGRSAAYDQPLQFAAILTDKHFQILETVDTVCRLAPDILPSPLAMAVTRIDPKRLLDPNLPSWFEFSQEIGAVIRRWAPATWIGYNNIRFDEEFLRQTFYQNLQPQIFETQIGGNTRCDLLKVLYSVWKLDPKVFSWPKDKTGKPSFKLDMLAPRNGFQEHNAHEARSDVMASIHLATTIKNKSPELWELSLRNCNKNHVYALLKTFEPLRLIERNSASPPKSFVGVYCGTNPDNPNEIGFLDLEQNNALSILDTDVPKIERSLSKTPRRIRSISINSVPSIFPIINPSAPLSHAAFTVSQNSAFIENVGLALAQRAGKRSQPSFVEQQIYETFIARDDGTILETFQRAEISERLALINQLGDKRLIELGIRLMYRESPEALPDELRKAEKLRIVEKWQTREPNIPWTTQHDVHSQLTRVVEQGRLSDNEITGLRNFYKEKFTLLLN